MSRLSIWEGVVKIAAFFEAQVLKGFLRMVTHGSAGDYIFPLGKGDMALIELLNGQTILIALIRDELPR
ncbi:hypothetical protein WJ47_34330 [Burkholderia ubonensis]|uniref:Uncharacterized protein n=1 Tax=Burkholderia ubonensis TaxID=101571 RepID=A0AB73FS90_9BURK|nr:hypothetical protein [Burkholderia ubonensis]KVK74422.1 hypothetical protein WJ44_17595 [Burkholderia ubonensis]KVL75480.1 hypothetical protein WJ47_34330 [Burkholderia ubonensis]KVM21098.1 hypothetical protein WJ53_00130 [Burkholderia ubonensis]KVM29916.1 hypothetical protein WJ54_11375 [Burkholderia ubonensis]